MIKKSEINNLIAKIYIQYASKLPANFDKTQKEMILNCILKNYLKINNNFELTTFNSYFYKCLQINFMDEDNCLTKTEQKIFDFYYTPFCGKYYSKLQVSDLVRQSYQTCQAVLRKVPRFTKNEENTYTFDYWNIEKLNLATKMSIKRDLGDQDFSLEEIRKEIDNRCLFLNNPTLNLYLDIIKSYLNGSKNLKEIMNKYDVSLNLVAKVISLNLKSDYIDLLKSALPFPLTSDNLEKYHFNSLSRRFGNDILNGYLQALLPITALAKSLDMKVSDLSMILEVVDEKQKNIPVYRNILEKKYQVSLQDKNLEDVWYEKYQTNSFAFLPILTDYLGGLTQLDIAKINGYKVKEVSTILKNLETNWLENYNMVVFLEQHYHVTFKGKSLKSIRKSYPLLAFQYQDYILDGQIGENECLKAAFNQHRQACTNDEVYKAYIKSCFNEKKVKQKTL